MLLQDSISRGTVEADSIRYKNVGVRWWHRITHTEIHHTAKIESVERLMLQRQLRWLDHVIRMPSNEIPRRLLSGELLLGQSPVKAADSDQVGAQEM